MPSALRIARAWWRAKAMRSLRHPQANAWITPDDYAARFASFNRLGLTLDQARGLAERELEYGPDPRYPGISFGLSTGTTGAPGVFLTNAAERNAWLGTFIARTIPLRHLIGARVALLLKHDNRLYQTANRGHLLQLRHFPLSSPLDHWLNDLIAYQPTILVAPPSALLALPAGCVSPRVILAGAEPLLPQHRARIEHSFGVAPAIVYQAREGFLATSCPHGNLHWNEDLLALTPLPLPGGRLAPIITDLTRTTQNYRNYLLEDVLLPLETSCLCGNPFFSFAAVEGRMADVLLHPSGHLLYPREVNDYFLAHGCEDYQLTQHSPATFTLATPNSPPSTRDLLGCDATTAPWRSQPLADKFRPVRRQFSLNFISNFSQ